MDAARTTERPGAADTALSAHKGGVSVAALLLSAMGSELKMSPRAMTDTTLRSCSYTDLSNAVQAGDIVTFGVDCSGSNAISFPASSPINVRNTVTVDANGHTVMLDGHSASTLFTVAPTGSLTLHGLMVQNGQAGTGMRDDGGAIGNEGTLNVSDSTFTDNSASGDANGGDGGAISNEGILRVSDSNSASGSASGSTNGGGGGAIFNYHSGTLSVSVSTFAYNSASSSGATGGNGNGGAIGNEGKLKVSASTFADNNVHGGDGGAIFTSASSADSTTVNSTIIANNTCAGAITDGGYNLEYQGGSRLTCGFTGAVNDQNPNLGDLQNNGGSTDTMADDVKAAQPAVDAVPINSKLCSATDQRGIPRLDGSETSCDLGAYEHQDRGTPRPTPALNLIYGTGEYKPADFMDAYNAHGDATNQTIGIVIGGLPISDADLRQFAEQTGTPALHQGNSGADTVLWKSLPSCDFKNGRYEPTHFYRHTGANTQALEEEAMDVEYAHAMAPHSHLIVWLAPIIDKGSQQPCPGGLAEGLAEAVAFTPKIPIISNSWNFPYEPLDYTNANDYYHSVLISLATGRKNNISVFFSSGDFGPNTGCGDPTKTQCPSDPQHPGAHIPMVGFPLSSPNVVAVGGTSLTRNGVSPPYKYSEGAWGVSPNPNRDASGVILSDESSAGGCAGPGWKPLAEQIDLFSLLNPTQACETRGIPDVAAAADPSPKGAFLFYGGKEDAGGVSGTSLAAPLWAGMAAQINRYLETQNAGSIGFITPTLYRIATNCALYTAAFHDVTAFGLNEHADNPGYPPALGWDKVTGLGSPNIGQLEEIWHLTDGGRTHLPVPQLCQYSIPPVSITHVTASRTKVTPGQDTIIAARITSTKSRSNVIVTVRIFSNTRQVLATVTNPIDLPARQAVRWEYRWVVSATIPPDEYQTIIQVRDQATLQQKFASAPGPTIQVGRPAG